MESFQADLIGKGPEREKHDFFLSSIVSRGLSKDKITEIQFTRELDDTGNGAEVNGSDMGLSNSVSASGAANHVPSPFEKTA